MNASPSDEAGQYQAAAYEQAQAMPYEQAQAMPVPATQAYPVPPVPQGVPAMAYQQVQPHSAALAVVASFFVPGLGSMLNEKVGKGIGILVSYLVSCILVLVFIGFIAAPAVWIWGMVAANNDAHAWNRAHGILS